MNHMSDKWWLASGLYLCLMLWSVLLDTRPMTRNHSFTETTGLSTQINIRYAVNDWAWLHGQLKGNHAVLLTTNCGLWLWNMNFQSIWLNFLKSGQRSQKWTDDCTVTSAGSGEGLGPKMFSISYSSLEIFANRMLASPWRVGAPPTGSPGSPPSHHTMNLL